MKKEKGQPDLNKKKPRTGTGPKKPVKNIPCSALNARVFHDHPIFISGAEVFIFIDRALHRHNVSDCRQVL
jgi:hypothetical protein